MWHIIINISGISISDGKLYNEKIYNEKRLLFSIPSEYMIDCVNPDALTAVNSSVRSNINDGSLELPELIISSCIDDIRYAVEHSIAHIFVSSSPETDTSYIAKYVLEDINALDTSYIDEVISRHYSLPLTIGHTSRLTIRELSCDNIRLLYEQMSREGLSINSDGVYDDLTTVIEKHKEYIKYQYGYYGFGYWGIFLKDTDTLIGRIGFEIKSIKPELNAAEGGYYIMPEYRNRGYAYEALQYITELAKESFDIASIYLVIECTNTASISLAKKLEYRMLENEVILRNSKDCFIFHN